MPVDGVMLRQQAFDVPMSSGGRSTALNVYLGTRLHELLFGAFHRGWQMFEDRTLLMITSRTDSTRMTLTQCMVRRCSQVTS